MTGTLTWLPVENVVAFYNKRGTPAQSALLRLRLANIAKPPQM